MICGSFFFLTIGIWSADVLVNPYTQLSSGQVDLHVSLYCSCAVRMPKAFGYFRDIDIPLPRAQRPETEKPKAEGPLEAEPKSWTESEKPNKKK